MMLERLHIASTIIRPSRRIQQRFAASDAVCVVVGMDFCLLQAATIDDCTLGYVSRRNSSF